MGEVSCGRQALEGDPLAPGTQRTLDLLSDPERRPTVPYQLLTADLRNYRAENPFTLEKARFLKYLKCATWSRSWAVRHDSRSCEARFRKSAGLGSVPPHRTVVGEGLCSQ